MAKAKPQGRKLGNVKKNRAVHDSTAKSRNDHFKFQTGDTLLYLHPPCREDDEYEPTKGANCVPLSVHWNIGPKKQMVVSLDPDDNPIIEHPFVKKLLKKTGKKLTGKCPIAKALAKGDLSDDSQIKTAYIWGVTPLGHRQKAGGKFAALTEGPSTIMAGTQINDGLIEQMEEYGNIDDPMAAIYVIVSKKTSGKQRVEYSVKIHPPSSREPVKLKASVRSTLYKALGESCDLFKLVASQVRDPSAVEALMSGVETDEEEETEDRPSKGGGKRRRKPPVVEEDDDDDDDEDDEDEEDEEEGDDDEPYEDDDEDDEDDDEEDDDEDDEEDDDDDEEEEPPSRKKKSKEKKSEKKSKRAKASKVKDPDLGEIEDELGDMDDEEEDDEEEDEEPPSREKKKKQKKKGKEKKPEKKSKKRR